MIAGRLNQPCACAPSDRRSPPYTSVAPSSLADLDDSPASSRAGVRRSPDRARCAGIARIADRQRFGPRHQPLEERVDDRPFDDRAARGGAALAGREERGVEHAIDRDVEVGVGEHDGRVLAAHLELHAREALGADPRDARADAIGAGERDGAHRRVRDERRADAAARSGHEVEHALRDAGLLEDLDELHRRHAAPATPA